MYVKSSEEMRVEIYIKDFFFYYFNSWIFFLAARYPFFFFFKPHLLRSLWAFLREGYTAILNSLLSGTDIWDTVVDSGTYKVGTLACPLPAQL